MTSGSRAGTVPPVRGSTVKDGTTAAAAPRVSALAHRIGQLDPAAPPRETRLDALTLGLVDALVAGDADALRNALDALRELRARAVSAADQQNERLLGWLAATISFSYWVMYSSTPYIDSCKALPAPLVAALKRPSVAIE